MKSLTDFYFRVRPLLGLLLLVLTLLAFPGCGKKPPAPPVPPRPVQVAQAFTSDVPVYLENFGNLFSPNDVDIVSQVAGKIAAVHFSEGDEVKEGDLLFSIDPREYQAALDRARAALAGAEADLKLKRQTVERNRSLLAKNLISQQEFDTLQTEVEAAAAQVKLDRAAVEQAEIDFGYCSITAPVDGMTGKRLVDPGNVVVANTGAVLVNIKSVDPLYLDFSLPENDLPQVRKWMAQGGLAVKVSPTGDPGGPYPGDLELIDNTVDDSTGTIALRASIPNAEKKLWPGQYATVQLVLYTAKDAILVPVAAVQLGQKGMYLFVIKDDNTADLRDDIEVGLGEGDNLVITKGVKAGERVVITGQLGLSPGAKVQIQDGDGKPAGQSKPTTASD
ncbi:MAG: efflux RND transporter periplasmic adaptor subunit [Candidatus Erginobacter occultus]|nr:efflux RND transporter periplasmic adaptor subunit [Candidatus Erginobacter occultus]